MTIDASKQRWHKGHDPFERPLGCNGKYGGSGDQEHRKRGEPVCEACRISCNHYQRERKRGQGISRPSLVKCGTPGGARRHYRLGEPLCQDCKLAQAAAANLRYKVNTVFKKAMLGYACYPLPYEISCAVFMDGRYVSGNGPA